MLETLKIYFLPCLINIIVVIYIIAKLLNRKIDYKAKKVYLVIIILTLLSILNYYYVIKSLRFTVSTIMIMFFVSFIFNEKKSEIIIITIIEQLILFVSELVYSFIIINLFKGIDILFYDIIGVIISNIVICFISISFVSCKFILNNLRKLIKFICKMKDIDKYIILSLFILTINFLLFYIYDEYTDKTSILFNSILIFFYSFMLYILLSEKNKNIIYMEENKALISNLNEYERLLDYQRINNHENKNQLLVIKSMVEKKDKKIADYINEIIKDKREDNELLYTKTKRIPSGRLQGLIYQKMLLGQEGMIKFNLNVSRDIRKIDIFEENAKLNYDVCRTIGIILDNAIEETIKLNKKEREILISMYVEEDFVIEISNHFIGDVDVDKIFNKGYTTKTEGHGYGLTLLRKIIDNNNRITNQVKIIDNLFTQIIKIKM